MGFAKVFNWLAAEPKDHYTLFGPNDMMRADFCRAARATERIVTVGGVLCVGAAVLSAPVTAPAATAIATAFSLGMAKVAGFGSGAVVECAVRATQRVHSALTGKPHYYH